jgi:hypothetical protein
VAISTSSHAADQGRSFGKPQRLPLRLFSWPLPGKGLNPRIFPDAFDSVALLAGCRFGRCFTGFECHLVDTGTVKIVVGMQHPLTTFSETARTPKKAADA